jgi:hypothetical protein
VIRPEDVDQDMKELEWYKPGNTLAEISRRVCDAAAPNCDDEAWEELQVYLRQGDGGAWRVEMWRGEEEDTPTDQPEMTQSGESQQ